MKSNTDQQQQVRVLVDGREVRVPAGTTVLQAAREAGAQIPTLCDFKKLEPFSSCYICLVKVKNARGFSPSCSTRVSEGMEVDTHGSEVLHARKTALELLLSDHVGDCEPPCKATCPANVPIREFLALAREGRFKEAALKIREMAPFPGALGRVCPKFCEGECRRERADEAVSICSMKRLVSDEEIRAGGPFLPPPGAPTGKKVAIIGAGPAGLTAAYFLRLRGHAVAVFEKQEKPGGMLRYGIPDYRLPPEILDKECGSILSMGVEIRYGTRVGKDIAFEQIRSTHDAIFVAAGAQKATDMPLDGGATITSGIEFLEKLAKGERPAVGKRVIVVGGGNTAMDAARSSRRLGAEVTILYRRTEKEMPANRVEIEEARHEGITFEFLAAPVRAQVTNGRIAIECIRMGLGEPDASGRRRPVPVKGSEFRLEADTCIAAIGQQVLADFAEGSKIQLARWGNVETDPRTLATNLPGVFAGGDCATGADVAVRAVDAGRRAAVAIDQYLLGQPVVGEPIRFNSTTGHVRDIPRELFAEITRAPRVSMPFLPDEIRNTTFREVETGFSGREGRHEAERCLRCGCVKAETCKLRDVSTEYGANQRHFVGQRRIPFRDTSHAAVLLESGKCINCGICVRLLEKRGEPILGFAGRGFESRICTAFGAPLGSARENEALLEAADACPTAGLSRRVEAP